MSILDQFDEQIRLHDEQLADEQRAQESVINGRREEIAARDADLRQPDAELRHSMVDRYSLAIWAYARTQGYPGPGPVDGPDNFHGTWSIVLRDAKEGDESGRVLMAKLRRPLNPYGHGYTDRWELIIGTGPASNRPNSPPHDITREFPNKTTGKSPTYTYTIQPNTGEVGGIEPDLPQMLQEVWAAICEERTPYLTSFRYVQGMLQQAKEWEERRVTKPE